MRRLYDYGNFMKGLENRYDFKWRHLFFFLDGPAEIKYGPQPWQSCHKLIYVRPNPKTGVPVGHWPLPESFWPDQNSPTLVRENCVLSCLHYHLYIVAFIFLQTRSSKCFYQCHVRNANNILTVCLPAASTCSTSAGQVHMCWFRAHGGGQSSLWQVWTGAFTAHTVHTREEITAHLLAGNTHIESSLCVEYACIATAVAEN